MNGLLLIPKMSHFPGVKRLYVQLSHDMCPPFGIGTPHFIISNLGLNGLTNWETRGRC